MDAPGAKQFLITFNRLTGCHTSINYFLKRTLQLFNFESNKKLFQARLPIMLLHPATYSLGVIFSFPSSGSTTLAKAFSNLL